MTETNTSRSAIEEPAAVPERDVSSATPEPIDEAVGQAAPEPAAATTDAPETSVMPPVYAARVREPGMPEASPDGRWLAYLLPAGDGGRELWLSPVDGGEAARLDLPFQPVDDVDPDTGRQIRGPQWSPDGATIAVTGLHPDGDRTAVWLVSLEWSETGAVAAVSGTEETAAEAPEAAGEGVEAGAEPANGVAADGGEEDAVTIERAGSGEPEAAADPVAIPAPTVAGARMLVDQREPIRSPRWSSDGALMLVVITRDGVDQAGLAQPGLDGVQALVEPITSGVLAHREPIWSRDGRFVAFTRQRGEDPRFADICVFEPITGELKNLTAEKDPTVRHSLDWVPGRNLVAFVTRDGDWHGISVVNADNKAGWMVTREAGDKWGHRFAPDEARMVYIRGEGFSTALVERGLHGSSSVALDPGEGVVSTPVWVGEKQVAYGFSAPQKPLGWFVQETSADAERTVVSIPDAVAHPRVDLRHPQPFEFEVGPDEQFSGLLYQTEGVSGPVPGAVYVPDGPLAARLAGFQREEQALASSGFSVLVPVLHGASGFGTAVEDDLADYAQDELEATDLAAAGQALAAREGVISTKLVLAGHGYGGALAMVAAGARPGVYSHVVAIDPVTDWTLELDRADRAWRQWVIRQYGLPLTHADRYALRTPETFAGVIDAELILVTTAGATPSRQAQLAEFRAWLTAVGIPHEAIELETETPAAALYEVGQRLAVRLRGEFDPDDV